MPCGKHHPRRSERTGRTISRRPHIGTMFGFRETGQSHLGFPNGEPPPTYQWVVQHANAPLVAYVNEVTGHVEYVKWDGAGPVPTRTVLGILNEGLEEEDDSHSNEEADSAEDGTTHEARVT